MKVEGLWDPICGKTPKDIEEVASYAAFEEMTPDEFVRAEEGTLDPETGFFTCNTCYINIGMPSGPGRARWVASPANLMAMGLTILLPPGVAMPRRLGLATDAELEAERDGS